MCILQLKKRSQRRGEWKSGGDSGRDTHRGQPPHASPASQQMSSQWQMDSVATALVDVADEESLVRIHIPLTCRRSVPVPTPTHVPLLPSQVDPTEEGWNNLQSGIKYLRIRQKRGLLGRKIKSDEWGGLFCNGGFFVHRRTEVAVTSSAPSGGSEQLLLVPIPSWFMGGIHKNSTSSAGGD